MPATITKSKRPIQKPATKAGVKAKETPGANVSNVTQFQHDLNQLPVLIRPISRRVGAAVALLDTNGGEPVLQPDEVLGLLTNMEVAAGATQDLIEMVEQLQVRFCYLCDQLNASPKAVQA